MKWVNYFSKEFLSTMLDKVINKSLVKVLKISPTQPAFTYSKLAIETWGEICSKLIIKTSKLRHWRRSGVFINNFEHISLLFLVFLLLTLNM